MSKRVAFFIETREGKIRSVSFEAATVARRLAAETGGNPVGIAVGSSIGALDEFGEYGIPEIIKIEHDTFNYYTSEGYTAAVCDTIGKTAPGILIITGSAMGKDLAPRIAARLDTEVIPDIDSGSHDYWYNNSWVSTDALFLLNFHAPPLERGLIRLDSNSDNAERWTFPPDYDVSVTQKLTPQFEQHFGLEPDAPKQ